MRVLIQRVSEARVRVGDDVVGEIARGLLVLVGFGPDDREPEIVWMADKLWGLRIFSDENGRMNRSAEDIGGALLLVSQFTLYGDASRGRRPSFGAAAPPGEAERLYDRFVEACAARGPVAQGRFGAMMDVESINEGPVTLWLER
ncbi:MAG: D-aminoacyl-tRNA deacylase [Gemmatimonadetes bacterium]|nr:D-aminoacyl-tRNA deacylase [Gemmatimonadota bacterium]